MVQYLAVSTLVILEVCYLINISVYLGFNDSTLK